MEKLEVSKEFVLKAYDAACNSWKNRIKAEFPTLWPIKYEVGDWVVVLPPYGNLVRIEHLERNNRHFWGPQLLDPYMRGNQKEMNTHNVSTISRKAETKEITNYLIAEAESRKLWGDVKIKENADLSFASSNRLNSGGWHPLYNSREDRLYNRNGVIYEKGKWAERLIPIEFEEIVKKYGKHEVEKWL